EIGCPEVVEVRLEGTLDRPWVQAKDIILELLRQRGVSGGTNKVFEFTGPGTADLSVPERGTIANMIAELGATSAVFPPDDATRRSSTPRSPPPPRPDRARSSPRSPNRASTASSWRAACGCSSRCAARAWGWARRRRPTATRCAP